MSGTLRGAALRLQNDLDSLTCPIRPWPNPDSALGYFEYIERPENDDTGRNLVPPNSLQGDRDDIIAFTSRSGAEPFLGQWLGDQNAGNPALPPLAAQPQTVASPEAEIIWWAHHVDTNNDFTFTPEEQVSLVLHRRVLAIRPDLNRRDPILNDGSLMLCYLPSYFASGKTSYNIPGEINLLANDIRRLYKDRRQNTEDEIPERVTPFADPTAARVHLRHITGSACCCLAALTQFTG